MGYADYSSTVYSTGSNDGNQDLMTFDLADPRPGDENILVQFVDEAAKHDRIVERLDRLKMIMSKSRPPSIFDLMDTTGMQYGNTVGSQEAILKVSAFKARAKVTPKTIRQDLRTGLVFSYYTKVGYSPDVHDFYTLDGTTKRFWGYADFLIKAHKNATRIIWKVTDENAPPFKEKDRATEKVQYWVQNFSMEEVDRWFLPDECPEEISSEEIISVAGEWGVDWRGLTRQDAWQTTRDVLLKDNEIYPIHIFAMSKPKKLKF